MVRARGGVTDTGSSWDWGARSVHDAQIVRLQPAHVDVIPHLTVISVTCHVRSAARIPIQPNRAAAAPFPCIQNSVSPSPHVYLLAVNKSLHRPLPDPRRVQTHHPQTWGCASGGSVGGFTVTLPPPCVPELAASLDPADPLAVKTMQQSIRRHNQRE